MIKKTKISVAIPTYNSWSTLKSCVISLQKQTLPPYEIIVIDNNSTDNTSKGVHDFFPKVKLRRMETNTGVTGGRNEGIKIASKKSDYIFFFDHDMVADKKMLEKLVEVAQQEDDIGIVTPKIYYWSNKKRIWSAGTGINLWTGQVLFRGGRDRGQFDSVCEVQVAPAAMLIKKQVFKKVRYFDNKYFATYEDTDYCFRAKKAGFKTFYTPEAIAYHKLSTNRDDEADRLLRRSYWVGKNRVLFMKDFGKSFFIFLLFVPVYIIYYLKMSIKYKRIKDGYRFLQGTFSGIFSIQ